MFYYIYFQVDHDVCSNYGNWQYSAGIGNDPREDRKFNMVKQGLDYDADVSTLLNTTNAEATFIQSTRKQIFLKKHLNPVMLVLIG